MIHRCDLAYHSGSSHPHRHCCSFLIHISWPRLHTALQLALVARKVFQTRRASAEYGFWKPFEQSHRLYLSAPQSAEHEIDPGNQLSQHMVWTESESFPKDLQKPMVVSDTDASYNVPTMLYVSAPSPPQLRQQRIIPPIFSQIRSQKSQIIRNDSNNMNTH